MCQRDNPAERYFEEDWDFAVLRQGYGDYTKLWPRGSELDRKKQWIFFRARSPFVLARLKTIDFDSLSRTNTTVRGFGKTEVVGEYRRLFERAAPAVQEKPAQDKLRIPDAVAGPRRLSGSGPVRNRLDETILPAVSDKPGRPVIRPV